MTELGVDGDGFAVNDGGFFIFEVDIEDAVTVVAEDGGGIEAGGRHPAYIEADADAGVAGGEDFFHGGGVTVDGAFAVVMDGELDIVFFDQLLEVVPLGEIFRLNDDEFDAHQFGEFEELAVGGFVEGGRVDPEGIDVQASFLEDSLFAKVFLGGGGRVELGGNELELGDAVLGGEGDHLFEVHIAAGPGLEAELGCGGGAGGAGAEREQKRENNEEGAEFHGGLRNKFR